METRPTKENVDSIKISVNRIRASNLKILTEQKETNKLLQSLLEIEQEKEQRRKIEGNHMKDIRIELVKIKNVLHAKG